MGPRRSSLEGQDFVRACLRRNQPGPYQIQAAIAAVHSDAARAEDTDWTQILALYDQLMVVQPSDVVALNRAVVLAEIEGPAAALSVVDTLDLDSYMPFHVVRADLLKQLGKTARPPRPTTAPSRSPTNEAERAFLVGQRDRLLTGGT